MTETEIPKPNLLEIAKQGNPKAIAILLNRHLEPKGITVKTALSKSTLKLMFEGEKIILQTVLVEWLNASLITHIVSDSITKVIIYNKRIGHDFPDWQEEIDFNSIHKSSENNPGSESQNLTEPITSKFMGFGLLFNSISDATEQVKNTVTETVSNTTNQAGQSVIETAVNIKGSVENISNTVIQGGKVAVKNIFNVENIFNLKKEVKNPTLKTTPTSGVLDFISNNPLLKSLIKTINVDKILEIIEKVDLDKVETEVKQLKTQYPHESSSQISHRIMGAKALDLGSSEIASKLVSERLATLMGADFSNNTTLEFEMIYQIAYAYDLDLYDPIRKDEALAIFSLALGSNQALKLGLGLLEDVPLAGTIISVSTNAAILYALGYAACRFYESNLYQDKKGATLETVQFESQKYLEIAIAQEAIMDQILIHIILVKNPDQTLEKILPQLQNAPLSLNSLEVISKNLNSPPDLNSLLEQINPDFAVALLAKYQKIANLDAVITPQEEQIINAINQKINHQSLKTEFLVEQKPR
jgi:hypothetical protein